MGQHATSPGVALSPPGKRRSRKLPGLLLFLGLSIPIFLLFTPSFLGERILLPLDLLALDSIYIPATPEYSFVHPGTAVFGDQVFEYEPNRSFVAKELRRGRIPLWNPYGYCGAPFANFHKYSPFMWIYYLFDSPRTLPWIQLLTSWVAGTGAYVFFRRVLGVGYGPALIGAWAFPFVGFFVLWRGYSLTYVVASFPWLLTAVDHTIRRPFSRAPIGLAFCTCLTVVSGQVDIAGQALLASGLFAIGRLVCFRRSQVTGSQARAWPSLRRPLLAGVTLLFAWTGGLLLSAPYLLPLVDYARTGARFGDRMAGSEERPPIGIGALPALLLPDAFGSSSETSFYIKDSNQLEGPAAGFAGVLLVLLLAPLALGRGNDRRTVLLLVALSVVALSWSLDVPGFVQILRLPLLRFMSHNRFVFVSAFAAVALAVLGLERLRRKEPIPLRALTIGIAGPLAFGAWCLWSRSHLPEPVATQLGSTLVNGKPLFGTDPLAVETVRESFRFAYGRGAFLCLLAVLGWILVASPLARRRGLYVALGLTVVTELLWFSIGVTRQSDPRLYYPSIPTLEPFAGSPDRILGLGCLPPNLNERFRFRDIRGYDGVDPRLMTEVLELCRDPRFPAQGYNRLQGYAAPVRLTPSGTLTTSPILDMLAVRYIMMRGVPPASVHPVAQGDDYWIGENLRALPRAYLPKRLEQTASDEATLARLADSAFDPREVAFVRANDRNGPNLARPPESLVPGPTPGTCSIEDDEPQTVSVSVDMTSPGLLVLADLWDPGWRASIDDRAAPILRTNHALRGVVVPAGRSVVRFEYRPQSFYVGVWLMVGALAAMALWLGALGQKRVRARAHP